MEQPVVMLERFHKRKSPISILLAEVMEEKVGHLSSEKWATIESLVELLEPCYLATVELSSEKFSSVSKISPLTRELMKFYNTKQNRNQGNLQGELASQIVKQLVKRFRRVEEAKLLAVSTVLHPSFKTKCFWQPPKKDIALDVIRREIQTEVHQQHEESPEAEDQIPPVKKRSPLWGWFDEEQSVRAPISDVGGVDLQNYLALPLQPGGVSTAVVAVRRENKVSCIVCSGKKISLCSSC